MLTTPRITQIPTTNPFVYAFRIESGVEAEEFARVAEITDAAMDREEPLSLLFILENFGVSDAMAGMSPKSLATQFRSLGHLERYAVVGAPAVAAGMIDAFDKVSSMEAKSFEPGEEDAAWAFVGARPRDGGVTV